MSEQLHPRGLQSRANCRSYERGHVPNLVMVTLAQQSEPEEWSRVTVLDVTDDVATLAADDRLFRVRTHDAPLLAVLQSEFGTEALLNGEYGVLFLPPRPDGTSPIFSVQDVDAEPTPCSVHS
jgi:hypothetical protein